MSRFAVSVFLVLISGTSFANHAFQEASPEVRAAADMSVPKPVKPDDLPKTKKNLSRVPPQLQEFGDDYCGRMKALNLQGEAADKERRLAAVLCKEGKYVGYDFIQNPDESAITNLDSLLDAWIKLENLYPIHAPDVAVIKTTRLQLTMKWKNLHILVIDPAYERRLTIKYGVWGTQLNDYYRNLSAP